MWLHAASLRQTAVFEAAGTGALTAWQAPAGYWPTDGAEGGVHWRRGAGATVGWEGQRWLGDLPRVATGAV